MSRDKGRQNFTVERVQTGVRMEKRMIKVLKALAEYYEVSLGSLLEGIVLHTFAGKVPFSKATRDRITQIKKVYDMDYGLEASHPFADKNGDA